MHGYSMVGRPSTLSHVGAAALISPFSALETNSPSFKRVLERARRFAQTDFAVLIQGEAGTGKTMVAEYVHALSPRAKEPFRKLKPIEYDDALFGSALFGHEDDAFTGAKRRRKGALQEAHGGTLFVDEAGKCSVCVQGRFLDIMENGSFCTVGGDRIIDVNVRFVFAANESLEALVVSGRMLPDFLARLGLFRIEMPPLRERREDVPALARSFVESCAAAARYPVGALPRIDGELMDSLTAFDWPGNVRELKGVMQRLLTDAKGALELRLNLLVDDLEKYRRRPRVGATLEIERRLEAERAVDRNEGNKSKAAQELGISRQTLYRRLEDQDGGTDHRAGTAG